MYAQNIRKRKWHITDYSLQLIKTEGLNKKQKTTNCGHTYENDIYNLKMC